ncbi:hypothetical protein [Mycolicibacterium fortuitum]|uniref:Uncharacterized protein n=2 Tax=Mycolicibacterium fortuitum TaxID=1766 RepID=A0AAE5AF05_MYCFO|nr:hypothetical protein [Mycolicibacterium fortuitum]MCV7138384.1 hypothetical protein [Mycolicibacterium fortuitum]MDV7193681.1 hypothetical protein [Mycolicibacterium fortuitum]MDV7207090.1 hypothetical protein [Mycolicibacterium fortuitum]MDV7228601.1 hypothetical protein [Mycolicibacterium fortuitum]MDV7260635.1 hypothetical protein [Mycolicibacterium fortuitum]
MSRQSKRQGAPFVSRDAAQFSDELARRFRLLSKAANEYDAGDDDQVVIMAAILRVFLTDRLIDRVTPLDQLAFTDTCDRLPASAIGGYGYGITRFKVSAGLQSGSIVAPLGNAYREKQPPVAPFDEWWSKDHVIFPTNRQFRTREFVVYEMANTDGIHVDADLDADYDALTRDNHGFQLDGVMVGGNLASAAVRQIAWETQHTLHRALPALCGPDFPSSMHCSEGDQLFRVAAMREEAGD